MEQHGLPCESREVQRAPIAVGTYQKRLEELALKNLYIYLNYLLIPVSVFASYVNLARVETVTFHQCYLENIVFAISYFMLTPELKGVAQIFFGEKAFRYVASLNISLEWKLPALTAVFILFGTAYRWYGFTIACNHLAYTFAFSRAEGSFGGYVAVLVGISIYRVHPLGIEDAFLAVLGYCCIIYALNLSATMPDWLHNALFGATFCWVMAKYVRLNGEMVKQKLYSLVPFQRRRNLQERDS